MKSLYLTFDDEDFEKLSKAKDKQERLEKIRVKWEDFVFQSIIGK